MATGATSIDAATAMQCAHVSRSSGALVADDVALMVPSTNPFLRDLLQDFLQAAGRARQRRADGIDRYAEHAGRLAGPCTFAIRP